MQRGPRQRRRLLTAIKRGCPGSGVLGCDANVPGAEQPPGPLSHNPGAWGQRDPTRPFTLCLRPRSLVSSPSVHEADTAWLRSCKRSLSEPGPQGTAIEAGGDRLVDRGGLSRALLKGPLPCLAPLSQDRAVGLLAGPASGHPGSPVESARERGKNIPSPDGSSLHGGRVGEVGSWDLLGDPGGVEEVGNLGLRAAGRPVPPVPGAESCSPLPGAALGSCPGPRLPGRTLQVLGVKERAWQGWHLGTGLVPAVSL